MTPSLRGIASRAIKPRHITSASLYRSQPIPRVLPSLSLFSSPKIPFLSHGTINQQRSFSSTIQTYANLDTTNTLPICCPGCGAYAQTIEPDELGYYSEGRRRKFAAKEQQAPKEGNKGADITEDLKTEGEAAAERIEKVLRDAEEKGYDKPAPRRMWEYVLPYCLSFIFANYESF